MPALRKRQEDIPILAEAFLKRFHPSDENGHIEKEALCLLVEYHYPGNVRELMTVIQTAVNLAQGGPITTACLPAQMRQSKQLNTCQGETAGNAITTLAEVERRHILRIYDKTGGNKSQTARLLDIGLNTLRRRLKKYGKK